MILQILFLTVIKTTGTNEGEVFYYLRSGNDSSLQVCLANTS